MEAIGVDPRDQTWEVDPPKYRVYFHSDGGRVSDECELSGIDIDAVMAWANINRGGRTFVIYACVCDGENGVGLVRLAGYDPNDPAAKDRTPEPFPLPTVLAVDGELFTAVADPDQPGAWHLTWDTGPNPGYGYMTRRSDHRCADPADLVGGVRNFVAEIDPETGYLEELTTDIDIVPFADRCTTRTAAFVRREPFACQSATFHVLRETEVMGWFDVKMRWRGQILRC